MTTISLAIIAKDCAPGLKRLLESAKPAGFDEIVIVDTGSKDNSVELVAAEYGAKFLKWNDPDPEFYAKHNHISDFSVARNFAFDACTSDWAMWADCDDTIHGAENIRISVDRAVAMGRNLIHAYYLYAKNPNGSIGMEQWRERIVKRVDGVWAAPVHEVIVERHGRNFSALQIPKEGFFIEHDFHSPTLVDRDTRNRDIILNVLKKQGNLEPRMWQKLGNSYRGLKEWEKAIKAYELHNKESNWDVAIYLCLIDSAMCYQQLGRHQDAIKVAMEAIRLKPSFPQAYAALANSEIELQRYEEALTWALRGLNAKEDTGLVGQNPAGIKLALNLAAHRAFYELNRFEESLAPLEDIADIHPDPEALKARIQAVRSALADKELYKAFSTVANVVFKEGGRAKAEGLAQYAPERIKQFPLLSWLQKKAAPKGKPTVAILCPGEFGPFSRERGIGGSEEAVICMSEALARLGYHVEVYRSDSDEDAETGEFNGVHWYSGHAFNRSDKYDVVICWRSGQLLEQAFNARIVIAWMHDLPISTQWSKQALDNCDYVFVLSEYHKQTYKHLIPEEKLVVTANGLDPDFFVEPKNDPKRVMFGSNPTRGLKEVLEMWPEIHERTGAVLHTYYGITKFTKDHARTAPWLAKMIDDIERLSRSTPGVVNHGMVGQRELAKETALAGIYFYPTTFGEISCISLMRAQAMGAIPVCSDFGALNETVQHGIKIHADKDLLVNAKEALIKLINDESEQEKIRSAMVPWARRQFQWDDVAAQWHRIFEGEECSKSSQESLKALLSPKASSEANLGTLQPLLTAS